MTEQQGRPQEPAGQVVPLGVQPANGQAAPWNRPPTEETCRCGRKAEGGYCTRCFMAVGKCGCVSYREIAARMIPGGCVLDEPATPPALWGSGPQVLASSGEATIICGPDGVGKTTLAGVLIRAQLGLGPGEAGQPRSVLGYPVALLPPSRRVLYLAMDRPRQALRSLHRLFSPADRAALDQQLVVWKGPPPSDLAADPGLLAAMCEMAGAGVCYIDSLKDAALGLSEDKTGAAWNRARQMAIGGGTELFELHHPRKATGDNPKPKNIEDVYGSRWIPAGAGSVIFLWGRPGDAVIELYHRKQPAEEIPRLSMTIDADAGTVSAEGGGDIIGMIVASGATAFTVHTAAQLLSGTLAPDRNETEKARRTLKRLQGEGKLIARDGGPQGGRGHVSTWLLAPELAAQASASGHHQNLPEDQRQPAAFWETLMRMIDPGA